MSIFDPIDSTTFDPPPAAGRCPLVRNPLPRCHCYDVTSSHIEAMIRFCGGNYRRCEIFQMISRETKTKGERSE